MKGIPSHALALAAAWRLVPALVLAGCAANPSAQTDPDGRGPPVVPPVYDVAPVLVNDTEVLEEVRDAYPPELYAAGIGGRVELWVRVDTAGRAGSRNVRTSSGHDALDCAAMQVARAMRYEPALDADEPTAAWITRWVEFEPDPAHPPPADRPRCEPFDTPPRLLNRDEVRQRVIRSYPQDLQNRGVGGTVILMLFVDTSGRVTDHEILESSSVAALDRAAVQVGMMMRFEPGKNLGWPAGVWVMMPIEFDIESRVAR